MPLGFTRWLAVVDGSLTLAASLCADYRCSHSIATSAKPAARGRKVRFQLADRNFVVLGNRFDASVEDIVEYLA